MATQLHLGKMTNEELAIWFNIKKDTFSHQKKKKLEELKNFAKFHEEKGKVIIEEIFIPVYQKKKSAPYEKIKESFNDAWSSSGLDTCSRVSLQIGEQLKDSDIDIAESTTYDYTRAVKTELYGKPFVQSGTLGSCTYEFCKKIGEGIDAMYEHFTDEEIEVKNKIIKKYFGNTTEKQLMVKHMVDSKEISEAEAWNVLEELTGMNKTDNFLAFLAEMETTFGCKVVRGTMLQKEEKSVFLLEE